jgi:hypothetical protein
MNPGVFMSGISQEATTVPIAPAALSDVPGTGNGQGVPSPADRDLSSIPVPLEIIATVRVRWGTTVELPPLPYPVDEESE